MPQKSTTRCAAAQPDNADKTANAWLDVASAAAAAGLMPPAEADRIKASLAAGQIKPDILPDALKYALAGGKAAQRAIGFLEGLFDPSDVVELRVIGSAGEGAVSYCGRSGDPAQREEMVKFINTHNGLRNIYFGANPRTENMAGTTQAASGADVTARQGVALDFDLKDAPGVDPNWLRTLDGLKAFGPVDIVDTGNGYHVHLPTERIEGASAATPQIKEAMRLLGSDDVSDPSRIMRLPWTVNVPNESKLKRGCVPVLARSVTLDGPAPKPRPLADLCRDLKDVALRLGLPGRGEGGSAPNATAGPISNVVDFAPQPAPSAKALRLVLDAMPNTDISMLDDRDKWVRFAHAFIGSATLAGIRDEARTVFLEWCGKHPRSDATADAALVDSIPRNARVGWGQVIGWLTAANPNGSTRVQNELARDAFAAAPLTDEDVARATRSARQGASAAVRQLASANLAPVQPVVQGALPPREKLLGTHLYRNNISVLVGPGGTGKSALVMQDAVALATGKTLMPGSEPHKPLRVLYYNGEDNTTEQQRRLAGVLKAHGIKYSDLGGRLFLASHSDLPIWLGGSGRERAQIEPGIEDALVSLIKQHSFDVVMLDPFGALHGCNENANDEMNLLLGMLRRVVHRTRCAMYIVHHAGKAAANDMKSAGAGASRGASAIVDAARSVRQLSPMTAKDVKELCCGSSIPEEKRSRYVRIGNGKSNLAPADKARWMFLESVSLGNGTPEYPAGDTVQAATPWEPPQKKLGTQGQLASVQTAIAALPEPPRKYRSSPDWVGNVVAHTLQIDIGPKDPKANRTTEQADNRQRVNCMVKDWVQSGGLVEFDWKDAKCNTRPSIQVGEWAEPLGGDADDEKNAA